MKVLAIMHYDKDDNTIIVKRIKGENITIQPNDEGLFELTEDMVIEERMTPLHAFERDLNNYLSYEQQMLLFEAWGMALSIVTSTTAYLLKIDKSIAKEIIMMGMQYGVLYQGNNNTWKIKEGKIVKDRWLKIAQSMKKDLVGGPEETISDIITKVRAMGAGHGINDTNDNNEEEYIEEEKPTHSKEFTDAKKNVEKIVKKAGKSTSIAGNNNNDNIPLEEQSEEQLRKRISYLQERLSNNKIWTELETPWMLNDEIHRIKAQLRYFDNKRSSQTYMNEANALNLPSSITEVPIDDEIQGSQIPSIGTPRTKASQKTLKKKPAR